MKRDTIKENVFKAGRRSGKTLTTKFPSEKELVYNYFISKAPEAVNPHFDPTKDSHEQLVNCGCMKEFRVWVNGQSPISDTVMKDVHCPHCGADAKDAWMVSGHSGGIFNASAKRS